MALGTVTIVLIIGSFIFGASLLGAGTASLMSKVMDDKSEKLKIINKNVETDVTVDISILVGIICGVIIAIC